MLFEKYDMTRQGESTIVIRDMSGSNAYHKFNSKLGIVPVLWISLEKCRETETGMDSLQLLFAFCEWLFFRRYVMGSFVRT